MSSAKTRRKFSSEFKTKVVIESLKERHTLAELATKYEVHANQISSWKQDFLASCHTLFDTKTKQADKDFEAERNTLLRKIGALEIEKDYLKKKLL